MKNKMLILLLAGVAACDSATEAEIRNQANEFDVRANWSATTQPVGSSTVQANVELIQYIGSRFDAAVSLTGGAPTTAYQWRIFRGDCSVNTPVDQNYSPHGLKVVATAQSYPDVTTSASGSGTASQNRIAAALDSLTAYSLRVRIGQASTNWDGTNPIACGNLQRS